MKRALIAMSGGVDSSVAALLMKEAGYDCTGATMRLYRPAAFQPEGPKSCCSDEDEEDAAFVCYQLSMPHESVCFSQPFEQKVIRRFISEYESGRTPNPCIDCNRFMKFDALLAYARQEGFNCIVTGHYSRVEVDETSGRRQLRKAADESKDQSYVLYMLTQEQLAHLLLPLGGLTKAEVRQIAESHGLINAEKRDSQDICFIPDGDYPAFIERWTGRKQEAGDFLDESGQVVGRHRGALRYTVGQRRGLELPMGERVYVIEKDMARNTVTVGSEAALYRRELIASDFNWLSIPEPGGPIRAAVRTRYHQAERPATVYPLPQNKARIVFDEPQRAITPGQAAVIYKDGLVLGGGTIEEYAPELG